MSFFLEWLRDLTAPAHSSEWINGAAGAGGAILGSLTTIVWTAWYNRRTRLRERREKFAAGAFASYQRLNQIYSVAIKLRDHLEEGQSQAKAAGQPACTRTMGVMRMSAPVVFPIEELWTLTQVGGGKLINRINSLDHSFNNLLDSIDRYGISREEVWSKFPSPDAMNGNIGSVGLTEEEFKKLAPHIAGLDYILAQLAPIAREIVEDTFEALTLLVQAKTKPLGKKFKIELPNPAGEVVVVRAEDAPVLRWWRRNSNEDVPAIRPKPSPPNG